MVILDRVRRKLVHTHIFQCIKIQDISERLSMLSGNHLQRDLA